MVSHKITNLDRAALIEQARAGEGVPAWHAAQIGRCYDYATYVAPSAKIGTVEDMQADVIKALQWWLRAPVQPLRHWSDYLPADFPDTAIGLVLRAADTRLRLDMGKNVHQSGFAALVGLGQRRVRQLVDDGEIVALTTPGGVSKEWIVAKSAKAWIEARQAARAKQAEEPSS